MEVERCTHTYTHTCTHTHMYMYTGIHAQGMHAHILPVIRGGEALCIQWSLHELETKGTPAHLYFPGVFKELLYC